MLSRIATAAVLIPSIVAAVWFLPTYVYSLVIAVVALAAGREWGVLSGLTGARNALYVLVIAAGLALAWILPAPLQPVVLAIAVVWWLAGLLGLTQSRPNLPVAAMGGWLSLVFAWYALSNLHGLPEGRVASLFLYILIWTADSSAFFSGRMFGRTKLAPNLSPGKTVEGLLGGIAAGIVFAVVVAVVVPQVGAAPVWVWPVLAAVVVMFSVIGDLYESRLKRQAGVKDSGSLLPGHGGVLDRIDSMLAAAPVFVAAYWLIVRST